MRSGTKQCPQCGKVYEPVLKRLDDDTRSIQEIYPKAKAWEREQVISGICSNKCWKEYLGLEEEEEDGTGDIKREIIWAVEDLCNAVQKLQKEVVRMVECCPAIMLPVLRSSIKLALEIVQTISKSGGCDGDA